MAQLPDEAKKELLLNLRKEGEKGVEAFMLLSLDRITDAALAAIKAGLPEHAIDIYEKTQKYYSAGRVAKDHGFEERAEELYQKAMKIGVVD